MGAGLKSSDPTVVAAFHDALLQGALVVALILLLLGAAWNVARSAQLRQLAGAPAPVALLAAGGQVRGGGRPTPKTLVTAAEAPARHMLRVAFGLLWVLDGALQAQAAMPLGLPSQVVEPAAGASQGWAHHLVDSMLTLWTFHPVTAAAAAVWVQLALGAWLLAARRGRLSRLAGASSALWAVAVWVFGEAFGQLFSPGASWLLGAPGAALFYAVAGGLLALAPGAWSSARLGRTLLKAAGAFLVGMALLQAWPGRGFWQGGGSGSLSRMVREMSATPQPHLISRWLSVFASFDAAHGWAVNLTVVIGLVATGTGLLVGTGRMVRAGLGACLVLCAATWALVQDFGFMGGVGTDPNSMVPFALLLAGGYLAATGAAEMPVPLAPSPAGPLAVATFPVVPAGGMPWARWATRWAADPAEAFRCLASVAALAVGAVGGVPMLAAAASAQASPLLAEAVDGTPAPVHFLAPGFSLVDQAGRRVALSGLRGRVVALTFLDPACTSDCPGTAQEMKATDSLLGRAAQRVDMLAVDVNPRYTSTAYLRAFDAREGLAHLVNWYYLTGGLRQLERVWGSFGVQVAYGNRGATAGHSNLAYLIDGRGYARYVLRTASGPGTAATRSSFAGLLAGTLRAVLAGT